MKDDKLLPGTYRWNDLDNLYKEAVIMAFHKEMSMIGFRFSKEQVRDIFMSARPVIVVDKENKIGVHDLSKPAIEFLISSEWQKTDKL